jgi:signal transduction histidine kinase
MWQPLGETIEIIRNFSLKRHSPVTLNPTDIDEFQHLNLEITKLTDRISFDYQNIKQFSENAAHELLTPLSIIRNKVDTLLSLPGMTEEQLTITASIEDGIDRLNRINRGLLQLSRIENGQFEQFRKINLTKVINDVASELAELLDLKSISYHTYSESEPEIYLDPDLAKILFNNLLNNAIKYTPAGGNVTVTVSKNEIRVTNSGSSPLAGGDKVFTRFYRENMESQSTGLGLAIVRSICTTGSIEIRYEFRDQEHHFILIPPAT